MRPARKLGALLILCTTMPCGPTLQGQQPSDKSAPITATAGVTPNLAGRIARPLRYHPDHGDFVIQNGAEFFNRSLYGGNTAFRADGGDKPEFLLYLPGRGGNLRFGLQTGALTKWLKDAASITTRYRPGELIYEIADPSFGAYGRIKLEVLAYADTEGLIVRATGTHLVPDARLLWAYGGANGQRGARDGDIGTEAVPISEYFQFKPAFAEDNTFSLGEEGFTLKSLHATIVGTTPAGAMQHLADADQWNDPPALLSESNAQPKRSIVVGSVALSEAAPVLISLQRINDQSRANTDLQIYREVSTPTGQPAGKTAPLPPAYNRAALPAEFAATQKHFDDLRTRVEITTPDPYLDAAVGALNVVGDALWDSDAKAIMHGAIAWRTKLLGWRGPYALDDLGWHDRAHENFETWLPHQNTSPIGPVPPPDESANLSRNEAGLHSNGDLSRSHYDMNMVFMDALFRHVLWTGDTAFAREAWPAIKRHLAWERRLFRREYGPEKSPLYEAYATIWASDDLYYNGGGTAYASAYNAYANRMAARIAVLVGEDPAPYTDEAAKIEQAMHKLLWLPDRGAFAEYKDLLGSELVHPDYGLWTFYHTIDEETVTPREAWQMSADLATHRRPIPVEGPGVPNDLPYHVLSETDWMPYSWSINNVVMDENMHTALALWESGRNTEAYEIAKGTLLASMYMGISPGNVGTMQYLDVYRRESQRDFGDSAGTMSRAVVEGLFGVHPDALAGTLRLSPGFPDDWTHAQLKHPDIEMHFNRHDTEETWDVTDTGRRFHKLILRLPARYANIMEVTVNGARANWHSQAGATGRPMLEIVSSLAAKAHLSIRWSGEQLGSEARAVAKVQASSADFQKLSLGAFTWWSMTPKAAPSAHTVARSMDWQTARSGARFKSVDLSRLLNASVTDIFAPKKYLSPRPGAVSLVLPSQGAGAWAGHVNLLPKIDDTGLRALAAQHGGSITLPNGVAFSTPSAPGANNIAFTSLWSNYPPEAKLPLNGHASHAYLLMAGSTNFMQSRMDDGEVIVTYTDGSTARLALRNPETWWPIEQDYFIDDYQFPLEGPLSPRVDLKTGKVRILDAATFKGKGGSIPGGAATVLHLALDPAKELKSLTVRTLTNDVVIGLMSLTLETP